MNNQRGVLDITIRVKLWVGQWQPRCLQNWYVLRCNSLLVNGSQGRGLLSTSLFFWVDGNFTN